MEYIDVFDINQNHLGREEIGKAHLESMWHKTFHCWIIRPNNKILFQLRSKDMRPCPDLLDTSAAGHLSAGETIEDGIREIKEELGINVDFNTLQEVGFYKHISNNSAKKGTYNKEFVYVYFLKDYTPLDEYIMQPEEVDGVYEVDIKDGFKLFNNEVEEISVYGFNRITKQLETISVSKDKFVKKADCYFNKLLIMAERFIKGEKYLGF
ncbi:MAG: NUDIX domain-containing protein [Lactobacillus sp.]|jgi:isopentenyldiphosphate isomerase|nr:NUDIX domain-containing protein [Lactobacillus sp.]